MVPSAPSHSPYRDASRARSRARAGAFARAFARPPRLEVYTRDAALALGVEARLEAAMRFFDWHSGLMFNLPMGYGFGQGVVDFITWEIASGRLDAQHGSPWWRAVNGCMVLDLLAAQSRTHEDPVAESWREYMRFTGSRLRRMRNGYMQRAQRLFWQAHQRSLHRAVDACHDLLRHERASERDFIDRVVLHNVDYAAVSSDVTYLDAIGIFTFAVYPLRYPCTSADVERAASLTIECIPLAACHRRQYVDTGLNASRWRVDANGQPAGFASESVPVPVTV
jgi:hypothetical protein